MRDHNDHNFGSRLRLLRTRDILTQGELAARSGLGVRTIARLETGGAGAPQVATRRMLADALGLDPAAAHWLHTGEGSPGRAPDPALPPILLLGREEMLGRIANVLDDPATRVLTLTGPGGVGKTSLAFETARLRQASTGRPARIVRLAELSDPTDVLPAIARALGLGASSDIRALLTRALANDASLLVIDNAEHLLTAAADLAWLIRSAPGVTLLVTSREALRLKDERVLVIEPLPTQPVEAPAVELFIQRARLVRFGFDPSSDERRAIRELCARLGGLPLAIELAASQMDTLQPNALLALLDQAGLRSLAPNAPGAPPHQATMTDAIAWSWRLLSPEQQQLMRAAAVFAGGFTPAAAGELLATAHGLGFAETGAATAALLPTLLRAHLLRQQPPAPGDDGPRFTMLEPIRDFALDRLREAGEGEPVRRAHAAWAVRHFEDLDTLLMDPTQRLLAIARIDRDYPNGATALNWARTAGDASLAGSLIHALRGAWIFVHEETDARFSGLRDLLADAADLSPDSRQWGLAARLDAITRAGDLDRERAALGEALARLSDLDDPVSEAMTLLVWSKDLDEDPNDALATIDRARALLGDHRDTVNPPFLHGWSHIRRGVELHRLGRLAEARAAIETGLEHTFGPGKGFNAAAQMAHLARVIQDQGFPRHAAETMIRALGHAGARHGARHAVCAAARQHGRLHLARSL